MKNRLQATWQLLLVVVCVLQGCVAGRGVFFVPSDVKLYQLECTEYTIRFESLFTDGFAVMYYFVPLAPIFNQSDTESNLEVDITVHSNKKPLFDIGVEDVRVQLSNSPTSYAPTKRMTKHDVREPAKPWFYRTNRYVFDIARSEISAYTLTFPNGLGGCNIPDIPFQKQMRTEWADRALGR